VLEVGYGAGAVLLALAPIAKTLHGIDLDADPVDVTRTLEGRGHHAKLTKGSVYELPYEDGAFDLVGLSNMIPFFDELERVTAPRGFLIVAFSGGAGTPIYVPPERLRSELEHRGFTDFAEFSTDPGTALLARKPGRA